MQAEDFRGIRMKLGLLQKELATVLGVSHKTIRLIESGEILASQSLENQLMFLATASAQRPIFKYDTSKRPKIRIDFTEPYQFDRRVVSWK